MGAATVLQRLARRGVARTPADGGWAPLPLSWLQRFGHRVADLLAARAANGLYRATPSRISSAYVMTWNSHAHRNSRLQALSRIFMGSLRRHSLDGVQAILRPYQQLGSTGWRFYVRQGWERYSRMIWDSAKP